MLVLVWRFVVWFLYDLVFVARLSPCASLILYNVAAYFNLFVVGGQHTIGMSRIRYVFVFWQREALLRIFANILNIKTQKVLMRKNKEVLAL